MQELRSRPSIGSIEGGASFPKTVVADELADKVLCSENAPFLAESHAGITQSV
jgi:hypothetical protein